ESVHSEGNMETHQHLVSLRAYEIWERKGRPAGYDMECWLEAEREIAAEERQRGDDRARDDSRVEGEGSYSAARAYDRGVQEFEKRGQVDKKAREAAEALGGPEAEAMRRAEEIGRSHSHGEDPALKKH